MPVIAGGIVGVIGWGAGLGEGECESVTYVFSGVIGILAIEMIYSGITGRL